MYREKYCQRTAVNMYASGKGQADVMAMLIEEGAEKARVQPLAENFYSDYQFILQEQQKQKRKNADLYFLAGGVLLVAGILMALFTYSPTKEGGQFMFSYGLVGMGIASFVKGFRDKNSGKDIV